MRNCYFSQVLRGQIGYYLGGLSIQKIRFV